MKSLLLLVAINILFGAYNAFFLLMPNNEWIVVNVVGLTVNAFGAGWCGAIAIVVADLEGRFNSSDN